MPIRVYIFSMKKHTGMSFVALLRQDFHFCYFMKKLSQAGKAKAKRIPFKSTKTIIRLHLFIQSYARIIYRLHLNPVITVVQLLCHSLGVLKVLSIIKIPLNNFPFILSNKLISKKRPTNWLIQPQIIIQGCADSVEVGIYFTAKYNVFYAFFNHFQSASINPNQQKNSLSKPIKSQIILCYCLSKILCFLRTDYVSRNKIEYCC